VRIFTFLGVIFVAIGAFFGYQALHPATGDEAAPALALVFLPMGIIFTLVGYFTTRMSANREKLLETGLIGQATVESVSETGVFVNERPMIRLHLLVSVPGRPPYTVAHSEVVPLMALTRIAAGSVLPVAVDPANPQKVAVDWDGELQDRAPGGAPAMGAYPAITQPVAGMPVPNTLSSLATGAAPNMLSETPAIGLSGGLPSSSNPSVPGSGVPFGMTAGGGVQLPGIVTVGGQTMDLSTMYQQLARMGVTISGGMPQMVVSGPTVIDARPGDAEAHLAQLKASGSPARATITSAMGMGIAIHGNMLTTLELSVSPEGGAAYPVRVTSLVPPAAATRAVVGATLPVYIDAGNPNNLAVDWAAA